MENAIISDNKDRYSSYETFLARDSLRKEDPVNTQEKVRL